VHRTVAENRDAPSPFENIGMALLKKISKIIAPAM